MRVRQSKYRNVPTWVGGIRFASRKEAARWQELKVLEKAGLITNLVRQVRFPLVINGEKICVYVADFTYRENGAAIVEDVKGTRTELYKTKSKMMWAIYRIQIRET
jgi:hypothetical protein